jgi:hypothetical protein
MIQNRDRASGDMTLREAFVSILIELGLTLMKKEEQSTSGIGQIKI